jgi:hypothetical protein
MRLKYFLAVLLASALGASFCMAGETKVDKPGEAKPAKSEETKLPSSPPFSEDEISKIIKEPGGWPRRQTWLKFSVVSTQMKEEKKIKVPPFVAAAAFLNKGFRKLPKVLSINSQDGNTPDICSVTYQVEGSKLLSTIEGLLGTSLSSIEYTVLDQVSYKDGAFTFQWNLMPESSRVMKGLKGFARFALDDKGDTQLTYFSEITPVKSVPGKFASYLETDFHTMVQDLGKKTEEEYLRDQFASWTIGKPPSLARSGRKSKN